MNGIIEVDSQRGKEIGFTSERFFPDSYLWDDADRVMVSFIHSRAPGNFRALVAAIHAEGKTVAVPTPLGRMEGILRRNGYQHVVESDPEMGDVHVWIQSPALKGGQQP